MSTIQRRNGIHHTLLRLGVGGIAAVMMGTLGALPAISALSAQAASATTATSSSSTTNPLTLPHSQRPTPIASTVSTTVTPGGVRVQVQHAPKDVKGYDFTKTVGSTTTDLTPTPSAIGDYLDASAAAGSSDTYTVKVSSIDATTTPTTTSGSKGRINATVGEVLGSATATVPVAPSAPHSPAPKTAPPVVQSPVHAQTTPAPPKPKSAPEKAPAPNKPALKSDAPAGKRPHSHTNSVTPKVAARVPVFTASCQLSGTLATTTLSPVTCPNGYEVTKDATIPTTATVTVDAGTTVYVATATDAGPAASNPTHYTDILVRGGLLVNGTASQPVTFTSVNAYPGSAGTPGPGLWGDIYYDGSGTSKPSGGLTHARISFGTAVVADVYTPAISDTTITDMSGDTNGAGLDYEDMPSGASISITGLTYDGANGTTGVYAQSDTDTNFTGHSHSAAPFSISVTNSKITGADPLWLESIGTGVTTGVNATITGDTLSNTGGTTYYELYDQAWNKSSTTPGNATVTGTISNDTINSTGTSTGIYLDADAKDSAAPTGSPDSPATCASGAWAACNDVSFAADNISASGPAVYSEAEVTKGLGSALVNNTFGNSTLPGGTLKSKDDNGYESYAYAYGTTGSATDTPTFTATTVNADSYDAYVDATAKNGTATANPTLHDSTFTARTTGDENNIYIYVYGSDNTTATNGDAVGTPVIDNSTLTAESTNVYETIDSYWGSATSDPSITGSSLTSSTGSNVYLDELYSAERGGTGTANANPTVTASTLNADTYNFYINDVYAYEGPAHSDVTVNGGSTLNSSSSSNIYQTDIYGSYDSTSSAGLSTANILVDGATLQAEDYNVYQDDVEAYYGPETANETIVTSSLVSSTTSYENIYADDIYGTESGPGLNSDVTTTANRSVIDSHITGSYYNVYEETVYGDYGPVHADISTAGSTLTSQDEYNLYQEDVYGTEDGGSGNLSANVTVTGSELVSGAGAVYQDDFTSKHGTLSANVTLASDSVTSIDGYGIYQTTLTGSDDTGSSGVSSLARTITNSTIKTNDEADYEFTIYSDYGTLSMPFTVTGSSINTGSSGYGVYLDDVYGSDDHGDNAGQSTFKATFTGSSVASYDAAVEYSTVESLYGSLNADITATNTPLTSSHSYGIYLDDVEGSESSGAPATRSTADITLTGSKVQAYTYGIDRSTVESEYGSMSTNLTATNSPITSTDEDAIYMDDLYGSESSGAPSTRFTAAVTLINSPLQAKSSAIYETTVESDYASLGAYITAINSPMFAGTSTAIYQDDVIGSDSTGSPHTRSTANITLSASPLTANDYAIHQDAVDSSYGLMSANIKAVGSPIFSADETAIYQESSYGSEDSGSPGTQSTFNVTLTNSPISAYDDGIDQGVYSDYGTLSSNITVHASPIVSTDDYGIYQDNTGSDSSGASSGLSTANNTVTSSDITAYDAPIYTDFYSDYGSAEANPHVTNAKLISTDDGVYSYGIYNYVDAEEAGGTATANPDVAGSPITSYEAAVYNEAISTYANAWADPSITGSKLVSSDSYGLENEAYGVYTSASGHTGSANANPVLSGSPINAYSTAIYNDATDKHGNSPADASFTITGSPITSTRDDGLDVVATSSGSGSATVTPKVTGSSIQAPDDYGVLIEAAPTAGKPKGTATVDGSFTGSPVTSLDDAFDVELQGSGVGPATFNTTFSNEVIHSTTEDGIDVNDNNDSYNDGGSITLDPTVTGGSITTPGDYAVYLTASGHGSTGGTYMVSVSPTISSLPMTSYNGVYLSAFDNGSTTWSGGTSVGGSIKDSSLVSQDTTGIYAHADCFFCSKGSTEGLQVSNTPVSAYTSAGSFHAFSGSTTSGPATVTTSVSSTDQAKWQAYDTTAITGSARSSGTGNVTNNLNVTDLHISGYTEGITNHASAATGNATNGANYVGNTIDNTFSNTDAQGIYDRTTATHAGATAARIGQISGNRVSGMRDTTGNGIEAVMNGTIEHPALTISQNAVSNVGGIGIFVTTKGHSPAGQVLGGPSPVYDVAIANNTVDRTGYSGIDTKGVLADIEQNNQWSSGLSGTAEGIGVGTAASAGKLSCNTVWGNTTGLNFFTNAKNLDPVTTENSFTQPTSSVTNAPRNLHTNNTGTTTAKGNWWGTTTAAAITATIVKGTGTVASGTPLSAPPNCIPPPIPDVPANTTSSQSASSTCPSSSLSVKNDGTTVTTGAGCGAVTLSQYASDPAGATSNFIASNRFFDVKLGAASTFANVSVVDCNLNGGNGLWWWNSAANAWQPVSDSAYTAGPPSWCASAALSASTSPSVAQLSGTVFAVGTSTSPPPPPPPPPATTKTTPTGTATNKTVGYWMVAKDGGIFSFGNAAFYGSMGGLPLNQPMVGMASTPNHKGYWTVASDGGIFSFGDAAFFGSMGGKPLNKPIVGITSTPDGNGYWMVASDGGIFSFGDAAFFGSTGSLTLNQPVVGMVASPSGSGYLLVAADGGLFAFGSAGFYGSVPGAGVHVTNIVSIAASHDGLGYWIMGNDGGLYAFGDAAFYGSVPGAGAHVANVIAMAASPDGGGYWAFGSDGSVYNFGDAPLDGSLPGLNVKVSNVVGAAAT